MVKVSVIIPCYNQGQYIQETLNSVLNQDYQDFEIIIVNDGSTDKYTNQFLENYSNSKVKIITTENLGVGNARNTAILAALGEYILPIDGDDMIAPSFLTKALGVIQNDHSIIAVSSWVKYIGIREGFGRPHGGTVVDFIVNNNSVSCALFRKELWENVGGYDSDRSNKLEDWDFWIKATYLGGRIFIIQENLFMYRIQDDSRYKKTEQQFSKHYRTLITKNIEIFEKYIDLVLVQKEGKIRELVKKVRMLEAKLEVVDNNFFIKGLRKLKIIRKK